jgi:hypothetical protein
MRFVVLLDYNFKVVLEFFGCIRIDESEKTALEG